MIFASHLILAALVCFSKATSNSALQQNYQKISSRLVTTKSQDDIDHSTDIYICEGSACDKCGETDEGRYSTQLIGFSLLDEILSINDQTDIKITICGSSHQNNPSIKLAHIDGKRIELKGKKTQQFVTLINDSNVNNNEIEQNIELESEDVTIIVDESTKKHNLILNWAELEDSPIEVENLTLIDIESDLISLSSVRGKLFALSSRIDDDSISKIKIGNRFITFNPLNENNNVKNKLDKEPSTVTLNAINESTNMDIWLSMKQSRLVFTTAPGLEQINGISNLIIDFENDDDEKATIIFDNTWNNIPSTDFIFIKHECDLDLISDNNDVVSKISVVGSGTVTRNGQVDGETSGKKGKLDYLTIVIICLVVVLVILVAVTLFLIFRKKCKKQREQTQDYNEYLNNSEELDPINLPA